MNKVGTVTKSNTKCRVIDLFMYSLLWFVMTIEIQSAEKLSDVDRIKLREVSVGNIEVEIAIATGGLSWELNKR